MDIKQDVRIYQNCDELLLLNFEKLKETKNLKWIVWGYDGWGDVEVPSNAREVWDNILDEYVELTKNNRTLQYFDSIVDVSNEETRVLQVSILLKEVAERVRMDKDTKQLYIKELAGWAFYYNDGKEHQSEVKRLYKQLEVVKTKLELMRQDKNKFEDGNDKSDLMDLIVKVQNALKRNIDKRKITVKEWVYTLNNLPKQNNG